MASFSHFNFLLPFNIPENSAPQNQYFLTLSICHPPPPPPLSSLLPRPAMSAKNSTLTTLKNLNPTNHGLRKLDCSRHRRLILSLCSPYLLALMTLLRLRRPETPSFFRESRNGRAHLVLWEAFVEIKLLRRLSREGHFRILWANSTHLHLHRTPQILHHVSPPFTWRWLGSWIHSSLGEPRWIL